MDAIKIEKEMLKMDKAIKEMDDSFYYVFIDELRVWQDSMDNYYVKYESFWESMEKFSKEETRKLTDRHFDAVEAMDKTMCNFTFKMGRFYGKADLFVDLLEELKNEFTVLEHLILVKPMTIKMVQTKYDALNVLFKEVKKNNKLIKKKYVELNAQLKIMHVQINKLISNPKVKKYAKMLPFELN